MENNKFYTPQIEEFCVGFEYEVLDYAKVDNWAKFTVDVDSITGKEDFPHQNRADFFLENLKIGKVRSKLLDREDIEACGWVWSNSIWRVKERGVPEKEYAVGHYKLYLNEGLVRIIHEEYYGEQSLNIFNGEIKNISELRRVMKMTKIE